MSRNLGCTIKGWDTGIPSRSAAPPFPTFHYNLEMTFEALALLKRERQAPALLKNSSASLIILINLFDINSS